MSHCLSICCTVGSQAFLQNTIPNRCVWLCMAGAACKTETWDAYFLLKPDFTVTSGFKWPWVTRMVLLMVLQWHCTIHYFVKYVLVTFTVIIRMLPALRRATYRVRFFGRLSVHACVHASARLSGILTLCDSHTSIKSTAGDNIICSSNTLIII